MMDANDLINGLLEQIAEQSKEIALLKVHLAGALREQQTEEAPDNDE
jgi:RNA-binding protein YhbY